MLKIFLLIFALLVVAWLQTCPANFDITNKNGHQTSKGRRKKDAKLTNSMDENLYLFRGNDLLGIRWNNLD